jgi:hypothetical protein
MNVLVTPTVYTALKDKRRLQTFAISGSKMEKCRFYTVATCSTLPVSQPYAGDEKDGQADQVGKAEGTDYVWCLGGWGVEGGVE